MILHYSVFFFVSLWSIAFSFDDDNTDIKIMTDNDDTDDIADNNRSNNCNIFNIYNNLHSENEECEEFSESTCAAFAAFAAFCALFVTLRNILLNQLSALILAFFASWRFKLLFLPTAKSDV